MVGPAAKLLAYTNILNYYGVIDHLEVDPSYGFCLGRGDVTKVDPVGE